MKPEEICLKIQNSLIQSNLFSANGNPENISWRISPTPYSLPPETVQFFSDLGPHLLKFYQTLNQFYFDSLKGKMPGWFAEYLDLGKPQDLLEYGRMNRFKRELPGILRPDVIVTEKGFVITELDSVPGGFGLLTQLMTSYGEIYKNIIGVEEGGIPKLFYRMVESTSGKSRCTVVIVVSEESEDYLQEMRCLAGVLRDQGLPVFVARPHEILFKEEGLFYLAEKEEINIDVIYRFFELYDLKNIPKSELFLYCNKKGKVKFTPPYKAFLEEKLIFALFHHPSLAKYWEKSLDDETFTALAHLIPNTWVLDNRKLPPYGVVPGLRVRGEPVQEWQELNSLTQKEREMVIKISGFSPFSWGGRGVTVGHDISASDWIQTLRERLENFRSSPAILQKFHSGKRVSISYLDPQTKSMKEIECRVRLTPYYFVFEEEIQLGGILATLCPKDKKKIHGMSEAIMTPCIEQQ